MLQLCAYFVIVVIMARNRWFKTEDDLRSLVECVRSSGVRVGGVRSVSRPALVSALGLSRSAGYRLIDKAVDDGLVQILDGAVVLCADLVEQAAGAGSSGVCRRVHSLSGAAGEVRCDCGREWSVERPALSSVCGGCGLVVLVRWF